VPQMCCIVVSFWVQTDDVLLLLPPEDDDADDDPEAMDESEAELELAEDIFPLMPPVAPELEFCGLCELKNQLVLKAIILPWLDPALLLSSLELMVLRLYLLRWILF